MNWTRWSRPTTSSPPLNFMKPFIALATVQSKTTKGVWLATQFSRWNCHTQMFRSSFGIRMKLYRAEGYQVLSILRFIYRLYIFCNQPLPTNLHLFCDSKSHLDKTDIYTKHTRYFPNTSLQRDWDVVQKIVTTIRMFPNPPHLTHVKAYQDDAPVTTNYRSNRN
jgi:hypothetical protein